MTGIHWCAGWIRAYLWSNRSTTLPVTIVLAGLLSSAG
jgi:hypothetical protein